MDHVVCVDLFQSVHNRNNDRHRLLHRQSSVLLHVLFEVLPFYKLHDNICCLIFGKIVMNCDEILFPRKPCHIPCFLEEVFHSLLIEPASILAACHVQSAGRLPVRQRIREILFDRDMHIQFEIRPVIGYAESALTNNIIDPILCMQDCSRSEINSIVIYCAFLHITVSPILYLFDPLN